MWPPGLLYIVVPAFADAEDAAYWSLVMLIVTAIVLYKAGGRELLRALGDRMRSHDD